MCGGKSGYSVGISNTSFGEIGFQMQTTSENRICRSIKAAVKAPHCHEGSACSEHENEKKNHIDLLINKECPKIKPGLDVDY